MTQSELDPHRGEEDQPGNQVTGVDELASYIRNSCISVHHPLGTCRMGVDDMAVVDGALKVHGMDSLRVVDASVMPDMVSGNINAPVIMIAEKVSDMIKELPSVT